MTIWGNHSATQYPDLHHTQVSGELAIDRVDQDWYESDFIPVVQQRGAAIIKARGASSAASAANAAIAHMRSWALGSDDGDWVSMGVYSDGSYGITEGLIYSFPCVCKDGNWSIVQGLDINDFSRDKMTATQQELIEEREEDIGFEQEELNNYQQKRFGPQGDWLVQKVVFTQPIQDKILEAVKEVAENRKLDYVFDRSAEILVFHSEKKYDISNLVVKYINQRDKKKARDELVESLKQEQNAARQKAIEKRKKEMDSIRKAKATQQQKN